MEGCEYGRSLLQLDRRHCCRARVHRSQPGGFSLPLAIRQTAWNQLSVESGYVQGCVSKRPTWTHGNRNSGSIKILPIRCSRAMICSLPLAAHPGWVYQTGRVANPWDDQWNPRASDLPTAELTQTGESRRRRHHKQLRVMGLKGRGPTNLRNRLLRRVRLRLLLNNLKLNLRVHYGWKFLFLREPGSTSTNSTSLMGNSVVQLY